MHGRQGQVCVCMFLFYFFLFNHFTYGIESSIFSMYRIKIYTGNWVENVREGQGILTYVNGNTVEGTFCWGQPHGVCVVTFVTPISKSIEPQSTTTTNDSGAKSPTARSRIRHAEYCRGDRIRWLDSNLAGAHKLLGWLTQSASNNRIIADLDSKPLSGKLNSSDLVKKKMIKT